MYSLLFTSRTFSHLFILLIIAQTFSEFAIIPNFFYPFQLFPYPHQLFHHLAPIPEIIVISNHHNVYNTGIIEGRTAQVHKAELVPGPRMYSCITFPCSSLRSSHCMPGGEKEREAGRDGEETTTGQRTYWPEKRHRTPRPRSL